MKKYCTDCNGTGKVFAYWPAWFGNGEYVDRCHTCMGVGYIREGEVEDCEKIGELPKPNAE